MAKKIGEFKRLDSGQQPGLPQDQSTLWDLGRNVLFQEQSVQRIPGSRIMLTKQDTAAVLGIHAALIDGSRYLYWGTAGKLFQYNESAGTVDDVSNTGGAYSGIPNQTMSALATRWSFIQWGDWTMATNGVDTPQIYKLGVTTDFVDWVQVGPPAALPFATAEILRVLGPFVLAFNLDSGGDELIWCDDSNPEEWRASNATAAGDLRIRDMESDILAVEPLAGGFAAYGSDKMFLVAPIGAPFFFGQRHLLTGIGAVGKHSVVPVGRIHYGLGPRGIFRTDGTQFGYIDDPAIHDFIYESGQLNRSQLSKVNHLHDRSSGTITWFMPFGESKDYSGAVSFNYRNNTWGTPGFFRSAAYSGDIFQFPVAADSSGNIYLHGIEGPSASPDSLPLVLPAQARLEFTVGEGGFGRGGFGGIWFREG